MGAALTAEEVERLRRVLPSLSRGQKRHPDTAQAMASLAPLLRMCARCGEVPVLGDADDLTCCNSCTIEVCGEIHGDDEANLATVTAERDRLAEVVEAVRAELEGSSHSDDCDWSMTTGEWDCNCPLGPLLALLPEATS